MKSTIPPTTPGLRVRTAIRAGRRARRFNAKLATQAIRGLPSPIPFVSAGRVADAAHRFWNMKGWNPRKW